MASERDLKLFGLKKGWNSEELKTSYRKLAKLNHPDADPANPGLHDAFVKLQDAYGRLLESVIPEPLVRYKPQTRNGDFRTKGKPSSQKVVDTSKQYARAFKRLVEFTAINDGRADELVTLRESALKGISLVDHDLYLKLLSRMVNSGTLALADFYEVMEAGGLNAELAKRKIEYLEPRLAKCIVLQTEAGGSK